jgi:hypothetical protein
MKVPNQPTFHRAPFKPINLNRWPPRAVFVLSVLPTSGPFEEQWDFATIHKKPIEAKHERED